MLLGGVCGLTSVGQQASNTTQEQEQEWGAGVGSRSGSRSGEHLPFFDKSSTLLLRAT